MSALQCSLDGAHTQQMACLSVICLRRRMVPMHVQVMDKFTTGSNLSATVDAHGGGSSLCPREEPTSSPPAQAGAGSGSRPAPGPGPSASLPAVSSEGPPRTPDRQPMLKYVSKRTSVRGPDHESLKRKPPPDSRPGSGPGEPEQSPEKKRLAGVNSMQLSACIAAASRSSALRLW